MFKDNDDFAKLFYNHIKSKNLRKTVKKRNKWRPFKAGWWPESKQRVVEFGHSSSDLEVEMNPHYGQQQNRVHVSQCMPNS